MNKLQDATTMQPLCMKFHTMLIEHSLNRHSHNIQHVLSTLRTYFVHYKIRPHELKVIRF